MEAVCAGNQNVNNISERKFEREQPHNLTALKETDLQLPGDSIIWPEERNIGLHGLSYNKLQHVLNYVIYTHAAIAGKGGGLALTSSVNDSATPNSTGSIAREKPTSRENGSPYFYYTVVRLQGSKDVYPTP